MAWDLGLNQLYISSPKDAFKFSRNWWEKEWPGRSIRVHKPSVKMTYNVNSESKTADLREPIRLRLKWAKMRTQKVKQPISLRSRWEKLQSMRGFENVIAVICIFFWIFFPANLDNSTCVYLKGCTYIIVDVEVSDSFSTDNRLESMDQRRAGMYKTLIYSNIINIDSLFIRFIHIWFH